MSSKYNDGKDVPAEKLAERLAELSDAVTRGRDKLLSECTMRVPAEPDRDADLVLAEAAKRLREQAAAGTRPEAARSRADFSFAQLFDGRRRSGLSEIEDRLFEYLLDGGHLRIRDGFIFIPEGASQGSASRSNSAAV